MSVNVIDFIQNKLSGEFAVQAASAYGTSEGGIKKAVNAGIPTILAGLLGKSETADGANTVHKLATEAAGGGILDNLRSLLTSNTNPVVTNIMTVLNRLFGERWGAMASMTADYAGVKQNISSDLLAVLAPVVLAVLGKKVKDENLSASGLAGWLLGQKDHIVAAVPSGFNLAGALGLSSLGSLGLGAVNMSSGVRKPSDSTVSATAGHSKSNGNRWLFPLLVLAALCVLAWYFINSKKNTDTTVVVDTTLVSEPIVTATTTTTTQTLSEVILPNGTKLQAYPGGIEDRLIRFIQSDEYKNATDEQLKNSWFNFDDLNFEFGTAALTAASQRQLENITAILKAFPDVKIKIGGYTDKKGDDAANKKLSDSRAKEIRKALKNAGVGAQVPEAEGYGEEFATIDENASDEERATDRKTAVRLLK